MNNFSKKKNVSLMVMVCLITGICFYTPLANAKSKKMKDNYKLEVMEDNFVQAKKIDNVELTKKFPEKNWWKTFNDPTLDRNIEIALSNNHDIKKAVATVKQSKALVREFLGYELPQLTVNPSYIRQKNSKNLTTPKISEFEGAGPKLFSPGSSVNIFTVPLNAAYEADIWLKNRGRTKAQKKLYEAAKQTSYFTVVLVTSEVTSAYFNLVKADKLIDLQDEIYKLQNEKLKLIESQYKSGLISYEKVLLSKNEVKKSKNTLSEYQLLQTLFSNQLAVLMGIGTSQVENIERSNIDNIHLPEKLESGVPAKLVSHRPDIMEAEAYLLKAKIDVSLAKKAFLPDLSLSGSFGYASTKLSQIFNWDSVLTSFTSSLAQTIFSGGARRARLRAQKHNYEQLLQSYYQTIFVAFQDVEDSLASFNQHKNIMSESEEMYNNTYEVLKLSESKYDQGLVSYIDVIDKSLNAKGQKQKVISSKTDCLIDVISVYKALGGGF